jgi:hypothetical protein
LFNEDKRVSFLSGHAQEKWTFETILYFRGERTLKLTITKCAGDVPAIAASAFSSVDPVKFQGDGGPTNSKLAGISPAGLTAAIHVFPTILYPFH